MISGVTWEAHSPITSWIGREAARIVLSSGLRDPLTLVEGFLLRRFSKKEQEVPSGQIVVSRRLLHEEVVILIRKLAASWLLLIFLTWIG